jgi:OOP family OmpA-OmpF porin
MNQFILFIIFLTSLYAQEAAFIDDDKDMVINKYDKCPNTPDGVCVNKDGCTQEIKRVVHFTPSSFKIKEDSTTSIQNIIEIAQECFGYNITIKGYTDSIYEANFNMNLSKKRSNSVKNILLLYDVDPKRIKIKWFGETNPISTNVTKEGRYNNRRVEVIFK